MVAIRLEKSRVDQIYKLFEERKFKEARNKIFQFGGNDENYYMYLEDWYREKGEL